MPVRDRLAELQKGVKRSDKLDDSSKSKEPKGKIDAFLKKVEGIDSKIQDVRRRLQELQRQQQNVLLSPVYNRTQVSELQKNTNSIRGELTAIHKEVKELERARENETETEDSSDDTALDRIKKQQVTRLVSALTSLSNDYFHHQAAYSGRMKEKLQRQHNIANGITDDRLTLTESEANEMMDKNTSVFTQDFVSNVEEAQAALNEIEQRHKDIVKLEKSVTEVNVLFQEISLLVSEQGEKIDNIESHVEAANVLIKDGNDELVKANKSRKKSRRCCIIIAVVVTILVCIIVAILLAHFL